MKNTSIFSRGLTNLKQTYQKIRERTKILVTRRPRVISTFFQKRRLITPKQRQLLELAIEFQRKFPYAGERPTFGEMSLIGRQKFMFGATKLLIRNKKIRKALLEMAEIKQNKKTDEEIENKLINELLQETKSIDEVIKLIQSEQKH